MRLKMDILKKMNLKTKAALFISITLVVVISITVFILTSTIIPRLENSLLMNSVLIGENLIKDIKKTVELGISISELEGLSDTLISITNQYDDLGYIYVADNEGRILYKSNTISEKRAADKKEEDLENSEKISHSIIKSNGESFYDIKIPIMVSESLVGEVHMGLKGEVISSQVNAIIYRSMLIGFFGFVLGSILITLFVNRLVSKPLANLSSAARNISEGNLEATVTSDRGDEIGQLTNAFSLMVDGLSIIVNQSWGTSTSLESASGDLASIASDLSDAFGKQLEKLDSVVTSISEMDSLSHSLISRAKKLSDSALDSSSSIMESTSAIAEINNHMNEISTAVENITAAILEMSTTVKQVAAGAESTANMAEETKGAISKINEGIRNMSKLADQSRKLSDNLKVNASDIGQQKMRETLNGILSIQEDVKHAENAMKSLNERVSNIGQIINVIDEITDQTNLLALNASIISAQAGEHGRSFAVVASEIRELSVRTSDSTNKISALIKGVQQEAGNYYEYLSRVIKSVDKGLNLGQEAEKALEKIALSAQETAEMAGLIVRVTGEQAEASEKVSQNVDVFTQSAEEIKQATKEETKTAEFIQESMEKTKEMIEMVNKATQEQNRGSSLIAKTSETARETSEEVLKSTEKERTLTKGISKSVEELKDISSKNFRLIENIKASSEMMTDLSLSLKSDLSKFTISQQKEETEI